MACRGWSLSPEQWRGGAFREVHIVPASVSGPQENSTLDPEDFPSFPKVTDWCYRAQLLDRWLDFDSVGLGMLWNQAGSFPEPSLPQKCWYSRRG